MDHSANKRGIKIGWAQTDITPQQKVVIAGQFHARISEGVLNPLTATVWALDSSSEQAIFVSCDLVVISDELRQAVRSRIQKVAQEIDPMKIILHATHTHTGPDVRMPADASKGHASKYGVAFDAEVMSVEDYLNFAADRIVQAIGEAWTERAASSIAYGQGYVPIGRNRRWVNHEGKSTMYGLNASNADQFRHIEGYEDHSLNLIATYGPKRELTGLIINLATPSQEGEQAFLLSADFWHETRVEIRRRWGEQVQILPQCSAAGDQTSRFIYETEAHERMLRLKNISAFTAIANRIADEIESILPYIAQEVDPYPLLKHHTGMVELPLNRLTETDVQKAEKEARELQVVYEQEKRKLIDDPTLRTNARWYVPVTAAYHRMNWCLQVTHRYHLQQQQPLTTTEVHVIRLGELAFATHAFECYLDFGIQMKVRSPAVQTFLVQLAGGGTYLPSPRSVLGGGYGSLPASNPIGPEGGQMLVDYTVHKLRQLWEGHEQRGME